MKYAEAAGEGFEPEGEDLLGGGFFPFFWAMALEDNSINPVEMNRKSGRIIFFLNDLQKLETTNLQIID